MGTYVKFDHVNANGDFIAILHHYNIEFTQKGSHIRVRCPFHDDETPSLSITTADTDSAQRNTFHCFGCKEKGSVIDFVRLMDQSDDLRACALKVAEISGCAPAPRGARRSKDGKRGVAAARKGSEDGSDRPERGEEVQSHPKGAKSNSGASEGHTAPLAVNPPLSKIFDLDPVHPYIEKRVKNQRLVEAFGIGFLAGESRSIMAGRVLIPIENGNGEIIGYAGRYPADAVPKNTQKYLLPPAFKKHAALFNINRIENVASVVIVEGYFGAIRLYGHGVPAVALMGTTMSDAQVSLLLERGIRFVLVLMDSDPAGVNAVPPLLDLLTRSFFTKVGFLPDGEAPDTASDDVLLRLVEQVERFEPVEG